MFDWSLGVIFAGLIAYNVGKLGIALHEGSELAEASSPFSVQHGDALHRVLVLGDSTAVGTGAKSPSNSLAGRLAHDFPDVDVENRAVDGAVTADVLTQLAKAQHQTYDLVLIQVGGNDALQFNRLSKVQDQILEVLAAARHLGTRVALLSTGDLGAAPAIPWPLNHLLSSRARSIRNNFESAAQTHGAWYIDLFEESEKDGVFAQDPSTYYARDGLHPSGEGYGVWYDQVRATLPLRQWLTKSLLKPRPDADIAPSKKVAGSHTEHVDTNHVERRQVPTHVPTHAPT